MAGALLVDGRQAEGSDSTPDRRTGLFSPIRLGLADALVAELPGHRTARSMDRHAMERPEVPWSPNLARGVGERICPWLSSMGADMDRGKSSYVGHSPGNQPCDYALFPCISLCLADDRQPTGDPGTEPDRSNWHLGTDISSYDATHLATSSLVAGLAPAADGLGHLDGSSHQVPNRQGRCASDYRLQGLCLSLVVHDS